MSDAHSADGISRPDLLFSPHLTHIYDQSYTLLIRKVCQKFRKLRSWNCFLPSPDLLSQIRSALYSVSPMARPSVVKNYANSIPSNLFSLVVQATEPLQSAVSCKSNWFSTPFYLYASLHNGYLCYVARNWSHNPSKKY